MNHGASSFAPTPGMPLTSTGKVHSKPANLLPDLFKKRFIAFSHDWNKYANGDPTHQWRDNEDFELEKLSLKNILENWHH